MKYIYYAENQRFLIHLEGFPLIPINYRLMFHLQRNSQILPFSLIVSFDVANNFKNFKIRLKSLKFFLLVVAKNRSQSIDRLSCNVSYKNIETFPQLLLNSSLKSALKTRNGDYFFHFLGDWKNSEFLVAVIAHWILWRKKNIYINK